MSKDRDKNVAKAVKAGEKAAKKAEKRMANPAARKDVKRILKEGKDKK